MQNPIAKLVPQYFGEYPKSFQKLFDSQDKELMEEQKKLCELVLLNNR